MTHGIRAISRFKWYQWIWLVLQVAAIGVVVTQNTKTGWTQYAPVGYHKARISVDDDRSCGVCVICLDGADWRTGRLSTFSNQETKSSPLVVLVNFSRPGWVFIGAIKMLLGSFLAYLAISDGATDIQATDPTYLYQRIFFFLTTSPTTALILAAVFVFICQMKINLTNAYAGSIAWSNFFSRLTHSHPGRVVWLVFNVTIALLLMELGIYQALGAILGVFAIAAVSWLGSLSADLLINKPLGLSPNYVEFKRAHLYDINPVGTGSMLIAT
ncbi:purine-cytosine permease family protein, partial [Marinomonas shanghaiensis]|uniref:purine-cytosine permease family protein n=1 Tax=Marinomonas shanghaiensis TaxID=2202418 RepID=UPI003A8F9FCA